jgi:hypothetical protein
MSTAREVATQILASQHLNEEPGGWYVPDIAKMIPATIREIVLSVLDAGKQDERKLLTKTFTPSITPVADDFDTVDLSASLAAAEPMFLDLPFPRVTHTDSQSKELLRTADLANLGFAPIDEGYDWYAIDGNTLYINANPELTGNLTIRAFYVPAVTNLPKQFESELMTRLIAKMGLA